uniref:Retrovirus-related Pol polyprotein from transposon TNT 1-94 n=1 Tax=Tanacetum cinerariifolium TaxID=118510 RepID=A0A6L2JP11_TANCI|nr:hypothetical protein [Tanacetum cinerariifolium]
MDMMIDQQMALDEALVPYASRLRIGRSNFRLLSDISSKESTLQLVYDVLRQTPFFKVSHKDTKKSNEMYYPRFTKVIIHHFMSKDPSIQRRNKVNWHYVRDNQMFTTIKLVSRHQNTQQFGAMLPIKLTNADIRNSEAYKEYYTVATGATPPKTKASIWKTKSSSDTTVTPPLTTAAGTRLFTYANGKQPARTSKAKSLTALSKVLDVPTKESDEEISWKSSDKGDDGDDDEKGSDEQDDDDAQDDYDDQEEGNDDDQDSDEEGEEFIHPEISVHDEEDTRDEETFDPIPKTPKNTDDEGNDVNINLEGRGVQMADVHTTQEFEDSHVTVTPVIPDGQQQSSSVSSQFMTSMLNPTPDAGIKSIFETTSQMDVQPLTSVAPLPLSASTLTPSTVATITIVQLAPTPSTTTPSADDQPITEPSHHPKWFSQQKKPPNPNRDWNKTLLATHRSIQPWISELAKQTDSRSSFNKLMDTPVDFSAFLMNRLKVDTMTPKLLAGPTYELMKGSFKSYGKHALWGISHWGCKRQQFYGFAVNRESARDVYSKHKIIVVTELKIIEWHNYKHLDWITMHRDDDKLYKFKEGDFKRLYIQDIEDMLLLLVQGKLTNLMVEERFAFNVSLRMFTRSIVIQRRIEDLQLDVESYQKKLKLTRPDTDGMLTDVRTALDDRLKGIQMKYLPQTI